MQYKKSYRKNSSFKVLGLDLASMLGSMAYGAVRSKVSTAVQPITANVPLGNISDEVVMLGLSFAAKKFIGNKVPFIKEVAKAGMAIEAARIGEAIAMGQLTTSTTTSTAVQSFR